MGVLIIQYSFILNGPKFEHRASEKQDPYKTTHSIIFKPEA